MQLEDLVGPHELTGVDFINQHVGDPACAVNFTLDGVTYSATEDECDGYRSAMGALGVSDKPTLNTFPACRVAGVMRSGEDILDLIDIATGKVVFSVGTDSSDDYYPTYVSSFDPTAMVTNRQRRSFEQIAEEAYGAYGKHQGNKNYQGLPMPDWKDLRPDIQGAWAAAVETACGAFLFNLGDSYRKAEEK